MNKAFGDKRIREAMLQDPLLRGKWEESRPTRALTQVDHLIDKVGIGIVESVERYYQKYKEKPTETNARTYCLWRLRLHRRMNNDRDTLEAINEARGLGLFDEEPGRLCWDYRFD